MSNFVFVIDKGKRPLDPIHPGQARRLLNENIAAVFRRYPFTIILKFVVALQRSWSQGRAFLTTNSSTHQN